MNARNTAMATQAYGNQRSRPVPDGELEALILDAKRMMYAGVNRSDLDRRQVKLVEDYGKDGKYIGALRDMCEIAWLCADPTAAVALPEILRLYILRAHAAPLSWMEAFRKEDRANGAANHAQFEYALGRSRFTNARVYEAMWGQRLWSERTMDAIAADRPPLIQVVR